MSLSSWAVTAQRGGLVDRLSAHCGRSIVRCLRSRLVGGGWLPAIADASISDGVVEVVVQDHGGWQEKSADGAGGEPSFAADFRPTLRCGDERLRVGSEGGSEIGPGQGGAVAGSVLAGLLGSNTGMEQEADAEAKSQ